MKKTLIAIISVVIVTILILMTWHDSVRLKKALADNSRSKLVSIAQSDTGKKFTEKQQNSILGKAEKAVIEKIPFFNKNSAAKERDTSLIKASLVSVEDSNKYIFSTEDGHEYKIYLYGINTVPKEGDVYGYSDATIGFLQVLFSGYENIYIQLLDGTKKDGYTPAYLWLDNLVDTGNKDDASQLMVNALFVSGGVASDDKDADGEFSDLFYELRKTAEHRNMGLWADPHFAAIWR